MDNLLGQDVLRKRYRTSGLVMFIMAVLVLAMRIITNLCYELFTKGDPDYIRDLKVDAFFSIFVQIVILFIMPLLVYKLVLRLRFREVFSFSNFRKTQPVNLLLAVLIGICGLFVTIGVSMIWQIFLMIFGYMPPSSQTAFAPSFNILHFLISLSLTAVLPAFCEEFTMRGGFLTSIRSALPIASVLMVSAFAFGLFHQHIIQTLYTALFGALMAFLTIRTKSIYPAMIVHFMNNGISVYLDYATEYGFFGGNLMQGALNLMLSGGFLGVVLVYALVVACLVLLIKLVARLNAPPVTMPVMLSGQSPSELVISAARMQGVVRMEDAVVRRAPPLEVDPKIAPRFLPFPPQLSEQGAGEQGKGDKILFLNNRYYLYKNSFLYALREKAAFKPNLSDNIFYIGAIVVTSLTTIFTLIFGFII